MSSRDKRNPQGNNGYIHFFFIRALSTLITSKVWNEPPFGQRTSVLQYIDIHRSLKMCSKSHTRQLQVSWYSVVTDLWNVMCASLACERLEVTSERPERPELPDHGLGK